MSNIYIGVYKALYDYTAQAEEELTIQTDDILYLLERSDVDDWWKVKKRVLAQGDAEVEEPFGIVPSNYIEEAPIIKQATALYDYDKQTEEEVSFKEGDKFNIYDLNDPDWILVSNVSKTEFGFVPSNYIELETEAASQNQQQQYQAPVPQQPQAEQYQPPQIQQQPPQPAQVIQPINPMQFQPPPRRSVTPQEIAPPTPVKDFPREQEAPAAQPSYFDNHSDDEAPPPMPSRPRDASSASNQNYEQVDDVVKKDHEFDGEYFTWYIDEIDGRKKLAVVLSIGNGFIIFKPNKQGSKLLRQSSKLENQWRVRDLISFSNEKKHVFLELKHPTASVELHAGSKDVAEAIISILADLKGVESAKALKEVAKASKAKTGSGNRKIARLLYDFESQGNDELPCKEGDEVYIINETKSKDWWMVENIESGRQGVVPSSYLEIISTSNLDKLTDRPARTRSTKKEKEKGSQQHHHRSREERDRIREKDKQQREKHVSSKHEEQDKSMPNYHRVRTWIDSSGTFKVEAEFLGCYEGKIHLHKTNGVKIAVACVKMSIEDLEYVEKVTGTSLERYKEEILKHQQAKVKPKSEEMRKTPSATAVINDVQKPQPSKAKATTALAVGEPDYDWFEFFLQCGVDIGNCQRYSLSFSREQMDENILEDISPSLLRTLGLREGDIIRVMKFLDNKYDRKKATSEESAPLFVNTNGGLKNNTAAQNDSKVSADALPSPVKVQAPAISEPPKPQRIDDDAWAVKPAARSSEDLLKAPTQPQTAQYTGSLSDLVNIKPLETKSESQPPAPQPQPQSQVPTAPALQPVKTSNTLIQPGQQFTVQQQGTSNMVPVPAQRTGGFIPVQRTGGILTAQPTGFVPITAQPTGFIPIQATGFIQPQLTFGVIPLQTGVTTFNADPVRSGSAPPTTFGQPLIMPGNVTMPQTTFATQITGGLPTTTFNQQPIVPAQRTGGQITGGFVPQSTFGKQITGGFMGTNVVPQPQTSFGQQPVGIAPVGLPQTTFGNQITGGLPSTIPALPTTSFGQAPMNEFSQQQPAPPQQQPTFGGAPQQQPTFGGVPQQQPTFGGAPQGFNQFGQPAATSNPFPQQPMAQFGQPQLTSFNQFPQQQPTQQFNMFGQQAQPQPQDMSQMTNMFQNASISAPASINTQIPNTSFGQAAPQFEGFNALQSQPTGMGFGNAPLQNQQTGRRANIQAATPDNPFGF
ncbi:Actin cytoskeleton-regulatory complex protein SLA1 [Spathaspora sp. JA1]|nr:Actin cytoskeleton-regulatory complex protein SLA1 [Spathaspora sp. JA1]